MRRSGIAAAALAVLLGGCAGSWLPWGHSDREQPRRLPEGAVELDCAQGRKLLVRHFADGKSAWIILPDREFRLDRAPGPAERYTNGATTLSVDGDASSLDIDGSRQYADCKRRR